jgi:hypothetical protein
MVRLLLCLLPTCPAALGTGNGSVLAGVGVVAELHDYNVTVAATLRTCIRILFGLFHGEVSVWSAESRNGETVRASRQFLNAPTHRFGRRRKLSIFYLQSVLRSGRAYLARDGRREGAGVADRRCR